MYDTLISLLCPVIVLNGVSLPSTILTPAMSVSTISSVYSARLAGDWPSCYDHHLPLSLTPSPPPPPAACWSLDQHLRPTFEQLLAKLQDISRSAFMSFPRESFYNMQENWKTEIDEVLRDIEHREKVSVRRWYWFRDWGDRGGFVQE